MMLTSVILTVLIYIGITYIISNYRKRSRFYQAANTLPGPKTKPIIGNTYYFVQRNFKEMLNNICLLVGSYTSPSRFWMGNKLIIFISEPDQIKIILQSRNCLNKSVLYKPFKAWVKTGLFCAPAHTWMRNRKMISPNFNKTMMRVFCNTFVKQSSIFMVKFEHMVNIEVDLHKHIAMYSLDSIYDSSFGMELGSQLKENDPYINAISRGKEIITHRIRNMFLFSDIIFNLTSLSREQQKHLNVMNSAAEKVIQEKESASDNLDENKSQSAKSSRTFLDKLMEVSDEGKKFTWKEIIDEINTIIVASVDTITITLHFMVFMLANFPEIQQKVWEELVEIYGTQDPKSAPVKFEDLLYMNYLERVIKETLRLFPAGPIIGRQLNEDLQLGEYILPKGADVIVPILFLHRNEKFWPKALTFNPDRFLPENMANIHPYSFIPFSSGLRNCIGTNYAMVSMKVFIATLLRTYILKVDKQLKIEEIDLQMDPFLAPMNPLKVKIEKRK